VIRRPDDVIQRTYAACQDERRSDQHARPVLPRWCGTAP